MSRSTLFEHMLSYLATMSVFGLLILWLFLSFWPFNPVDIDYVRLLSDKIVAGGVIKYEIGVVKTTDMPGRLIKDLVVTSTDCTQHIYHLSDMAGSLPLGRHVIVSSVEIPAGVVSGVGHIRFVAIYNYPMGRTITETFKTKDVPVIGGGGRK